MAKKNRNQNRTSQKLIPQKEEYLLLEDFAGIELESGDNIKPIDEVNGFKIRPGFYEINGASALPEGVNFTLVTYSGTSCELLLFHRKAQVPYARIPFPPDYRVGNVYSMFVFGLKADEFEYAYSIDGPWDPSKGLLFDREKYLLDPYAKAVTGQSEWGKQLTGDAFYKARVVHNNFHWEIPKKKPAVSSLQDCIIYEMHVRGFTRHESSGVKHPGTFEGIREKIPYLLELGINAVELMPVFEFDETRNMRTVNGRKLLDYWGYNPVCFFAPNTSYASEQEYNREGTELKRLIRDLHKNGIKVILDVVFNHTAEGNENGPFFSFKGFDNNIYYMLTPDGKYYNFSGCGNTLNCNHPMVRDMILNCLRYWTTSYHVDGFRFDLASILGRSEDSSPMSRPPLLERLAYDPILYSTDLIAEAWDAGGLYQVGSFPSWNRWAEWNGKYRDDLRSFLKGDGGLAGAAAMRILGSSDLYPREKRGDNASVNFITCHDGFTLYDLYSYNQKHNEDNGWENTDGSNDNRSWNCGEEGDTQNPEILRLRRQLMKNACAVLMCSRGTPMFLAGDEFGNTQFGNNNPYCQDNEISWLNWEQLKDNEEIFEFFKFMIHFRKDHTILRKDTSPSSSGFPFLSLHGTEPWQEEYGPDTRTIGIMFAGQEEDGREDILYLGINAWWEQVQIELPRLPQGFCWVPIIDTSRGREAVIREEELLDQNLYVMNPRSVCIYTGKQL